jgi:hypothetical protein
MAQSGFPAWSDHHVFVRVEKNESGILILFKGILERQDSIAGLHEFFSQLNKGLEQLTNPCIELDFSLLKSVNNDGIRTLVDIFQHVIQFMGADCTLILSYDPRYDWQKRLFPSMNSMFPTQSNLKVLPSMQGYEQMPDQVPSLILAGITGKLYDELALYLLSNGARLATLPNVKEIEHALKHVEVDAILMEPAALQGISTEDPIPWIKGLKALRSPRFFVLTKNKSEIKHLSPELIVEMINDNGSDAFVAEQVVRKIQKTGILDPKINMHVRIPVPEKDGVRIEIPNSKNQILQAHVLNLSLRGLFVKIKDDSTPHSIRFNTAYPNVDLFLQRKTIHFTLIPIFIKESYFGAHFTGLSGGDEQILVSYILREMNSLFLSKIPKDPSL